MTLGQIAGLIAALAAVVLVALCAVPLLKLGGVLDEVRKAVRDVDESTVPILEELKSTVVITNGEISKLDQVIEDIHTISSMAPSLLARPPSWPKPLPRPSGRQWSRLRLLVRECAEQFIVRSVGCVSPKLRIRSVLPR